MTSEFIDAYSDDQIYINMLEGLLEAHSAEPSTEERMGYPSLSRLWAVMMVGSVECMVKEWTANRPGLSDIYAYFQDGSNEERIQRLREAFKLRGLPLNTSAFVDFLAVKYIRNSYVHAEWNTLQRQFVADQGFPVDIRHFDKGHFGRMKVSYEHVMNNLGMAAAFDSLHTD